MPQTMRAIIKDPKTCFIFIANAVDSEPEITGYEIAKALTDKNIWLASKSTPFLNYYTTGKKVLLYVAGKNFRCFIGNAQIADVLRDLTEEEIALSKELGLRGFNKTIPLKEVKIWKDKIFIKDYVEDLEFIKDKKNYGLHLRQASVRIGEDDYKTIISLADKLVRP
jgi:predicted RNA-binding protein